MGVVSASARLHYGGPTAHSFRLTSSDVLSGPSRRKLMLAYGLGDAGTGLAATQLGFYLFPFFTCAAGLPAFIAGSLLTVIKVWDALNDPLIGWLSDHTNSRWGPRLPWMLSAALPLGISLATMVGSQRWPGATHGVLRGDGDPVDDRLHQRQPALCRPVDGTDAEHGDPHPVECGPLHRFDPGGPERPDRGLGGAQRRWRRLPAHGSDHRHDCGGNHPALLLGPGALRQAGAAAGA